MYVGDDVSPDFYGWVFPKYDHVGVGTGTVVNRPAIKDYQVRNVGQSTRGCLTSVAVVRGGALQLCTSQPDGVQKLPLMMFIGERILLNALTMEMIR